jgi:hypothetical protein
MFTNICQVLNMIEGSILILILMKLRELKSKRAGDTYLYSSNSNLENPRGDRSPCESSLSSRALG